MAVTPGAASGVVETERLRLEPLRPEHAALLMPIMLDPRVARWYRAPDAPPTSETDVIAGVERHAAAWASGGFGFGFWLLSDRHTGDVVGRGGLSRTNATGVDEVEVGWAIAPARWRQGLATELARAAIEYASITLTLDQLIAYTMSDNVASRRVMEKTGFRYERDFQHAGVPHALYRHVLGSV